jgi:NAD(P)-dependent dehydrogenase (short-subunit alcohol dehydrogenase family)
MDRTGRGGGVTAGPKVALITGCSSGIGRDLAQRMTDAGYTVVATARRPESLDGLDVALTLPLDVTSEGSARVAVEATLERFGRIDVLVNNAGYAEQSAIEELSGDALRSMFEVNVFGVARMLRAVAPAMRRQGSGAIVNISSLAGRMSMPVNGAYSASKFAVEALSDAARQELAAFGVRVILVEPGSIGTGFSDAMMARSQATLEDADSPYRELYERNLALYFQLRDGDAAPEAVTAVVLKALSARRPKARYVAAIPLLAQLMFGLSAGVRDRLWAGALARAARPAEARA